MGSHWNSEQILREEIFSIERLEQHARSLAAAQPVTRQPGFRRSLGSRLRNNEKALLAAYRSIARAVDEGRAITPAAEWVLDNFHVVEEQIREIREDLPPGFYRQLPKLAEGPFAGFPRVFGIAWAFVAHTDSRFDPEFLRRFVRRLPDRRAAHHRRVVGGGDHAAHRAGREPAARRATHRDQPRRTAGGRRDRRPAARCQRADPSMPMRCNEWKRRSGKLTPAFAVQLVQRLRDQDPKVTPALVWLEDELRACNLDTDRVVQEEHQRQGASNVTVRNIITSMRLMSDVDWAEFFESVSLVDEALNASGEFRAMDFATRNLYRNAIEVLARGAPLSELDIARRVIDLAADAQQPRERDPGFWLIADGRARLERAIGFRASLRDLRGRISFTVGAADYVAAIAFTWALLLAVPLALMQQAGVHGPLLWLLGVLAARSRSRTSPWRWSIAP